MSRGREEEGQGKGGEQRKVEGGRGRIGVRETDRCSIDTPSDWGRE